MSSLALTHPALAHLFERVIQTSGGSTFGYHALDHLYTTNIDKLRDHDEQQHGEHG
jgi:hypothetical protein